jgi:hypothetical protein
MVSEQMFSVREYSVQLYMYERMYSSVRLYTLTVNSVRMYSRDINRGYQY